MLVIIILREKEFGTTDERGSDRSILSYDLGATKFLSSAHGTKSPWNGGPKGIGCLLSSLLEGPILRSESRNGIPLNNQ